MANDTYAFGKPVSSQIQSAILSAPSMNTTPSPSQPKQYPSNELAKLYAQLLYLAQQALKCENDYSKKQQLIEHVQFYDRAVHAELERASAEGAPVPNLPGPPPAPEPNPAAGQAPGMPPLAAPPAQNPGAPLAPPQPGGSPA